MDKIDEDKLFHSFYDSPITLIQNGINTTLEDGVFKAVLSTGIDVDKVTLIKALNADRDRYTEAYERGYREGYNKCYADMSLTNDEYSGIR